LKDNYVYLTDSKVESPIFGLSN